MFNGGAEDVKMLGSEECFCPFLSIIKKIAHQGSANFPPRVLTAGSLHAVTNGAAGSSEGGASAG